MTLALLAGVLALTLLEAIVPAQGVLFVRQVMRHVLAEPPGDRARRLAAAAATVVEAVGLGGRITLGDQRLVSGFATGQRCEQKQDADGAERHGDSRVPKGGRTRRMERHATGRVA